MTESNDIFAECQATWTGYESDPCAGDLLAASRRLCGEVRRGREPIGAARELAAMEGARSSHLRAVLLSADPSADPSAITLIARAVWAAVNQPGTVRAELAAAERAWGLR